jgi:drug/metabolite transporter superfamily protein YnfA
VGVELVVGGVAVVVPPSVAPTGSTEGVFVVEGVFAVAVVDGARASRFDGVGRGVSLRHCESVRSDRERSTWAGFMAR